MKHYIIVKFNDTIKDRQLLLRQISQLFSQAANIDGVLGVSVHPAVLMSEKRYDLMICMDMEKEEALALFDQSSVHRLWKESFSQYIAHKVIFDCA